VVKVKTSIYVDKEIWEMFKRHALRRGVEVSRLLEDMMVDEVVEELLDKALLELAGPQDYEVDFEPGEPKEGLVSELVKVMRDERAGSIP